MYFSLGHKLSTKLPVFVGPQHCFYLRYTSVDLWFLQKDSIVCFNTIHEILDKSLGTSLDMLETVTSNDCDLAICLRKAL